MSTAVLRLTFLLNTNLNTPYLEEQANDSISRVSVINVVAHSIAQ